MYQPQFWHTKSGVSAGRKDAVRIHTDSNHPLRCEQVVHTQTNIDTRFVRALFGEIEANTSIDIRTQSLER
jgi:hypothetical protein